VRFVRFFARLFSKEYRVNCLPPKEPCVYVARHLDLRGPITAIKWFDFDFHPMVFSVFFTKRECYRQYADYTFTKRHGKKSGGFNLKAYFASRAVVPLVKGIGAVPVYRDRGTFKTFKAELDCLLKGESVMVYPDIDYTAPADKISDIYEGFIFIGEYYKKKTGKSLSFVPIYINDEKLTVYEGTPVTADDFASDKERVATYLKAAINGRALTREDASSGALSN